MSRRTQVISNSFKITQLPTKEYYMYDVFLPEIKQMEKRNMLFHHLQVTVAPQLFHRRLVYDGKAIAYSPGRLDLGGNSGITFYISLGHKTQTARDARGACKLTLNLTSSPPIVPKHVYDIIRSGVASTRSATATNLLQLIVRQGPNQHHTNNGRAYFTGKDTKPIDGSGIELWRGVFQSVRPAIGKMILTIDTSTALVYKSGPLISVALDFLDDTSRNVRDLRLWERDVNYKKLEKFLKNLRIKVKTGANGSKSRIKTIRGLEPAAGEYTFEKDGEETTVQRYFYQAYGVRIAYPGIIGVRLTGRHASHADIVPAELCEIEYGQLFRQTIPEKFTSHMVRFSTMKPQERLRKIMDAVAYTRSEYIIESGMIVDTNALKIDAKILPTPSVEYGRNSNPRISNGGWNVLGQTLHEPRSLNSWAIVNFCPSNISQRHCETIVQGLTNSGTNLGMVFKPPHDIYTAQGQNVVNDLNRIMADIDRKLKRNLKFLMETVLVVLLPSSAAPIRTAVKRWGDDTHCIRTQCLRENKLMVANNQYWNNVVLKLNARLGGRNWKVVSPAMDRFEKTAFIIMGADVSHPAPGAQKPSITSLVYSHDRHATMYAAITGIQDPRTEIIENLKEYAERAVESWYQKHGILPRNMLFFRDGVSEGEYERVIEKELPAIRAACKAVWAKLAKKDPLPLLTFIVVTKRHHAVFFPASRQEGDSKGNLHPGSVIDSEITHPGYPNFYLQSHTAIQGTARSSHYIVLEDEIFNARNDLSEIQSLSYALCHVYAKATRSISIPAPVYYADLACSPERCYIDPDTLRDFEERLSGSSGQATFDLSAWKAAFLRTNTAMGKNKTMYFL